jgi:hypothetical protein
MLKRQLPDKDIIFHLETEYDIGTIEKIPNRDGNYKYEPFRGIGHYEMATQLESGAGAKCYVRQSKFTVKNIPEYGVIKIEMGW